MTNSGELIAINGVVVINDTAEKVLNADSYYVAEDTVIATTRSKRRRCYRCASRLHYNPCDWSKGRSTNNTTERRLL